MKDNVLKRLAQKIYYRPNSIRRIIVGPLRGMLFRVSNVSGLMPVYSGNEPWHQKILRALLKKGGVCIDIGAGWGMHTLYASQLVGEAGIVIAIEPFPIAFKELQWHIERNLCTNTILLNVAMSESNGESTLLSGPNSGQGFLATAIEGEIDKAIVLEEYSVCVKTLDTIAKEIALKKIDVIKVDVEGSEGNVLRGAEAVVRKYRPYFIIDSHTPANDVFIGRWFTDRGYRLERVDKTLPPVLHVDRDRSDKNGISGALLASP